ncbi:hypothetical protein [Streptomyces sp. NPDC046685]|uniref:hypothetical protein n=1 Tax=Streptomyces sp. NPDC046685 TaxID=3157202 RepID=UPI0033EAA3B3
MNDRKSEDRQRLEDLRRAIHVASRDPDLLEDLLTKALGEIDYLWWKVMYLQGQLELEHERPGNGPGAASTATTGPYPAPSPSPPRVRGKTHRWRHAVAQALHGDGQRGGSS